MATNDTTTTPPHIRIGSGKTTIGEVRLNPDTGEIEITSGDREKLARLLTSMYHGRFKDETELYRSLTTRLNNGYMWAREVAAESAKD